MTFWGGSQLAEQVPKLGIVKPFDENLIDCNAYTLRMGDEYYITPEAGFSLRKNKKKFLKQNTYFSESQGKFVKRGESFTIPPGQFAFLLTEEVVSIPDNLMGWISLRSGIKFKGLVNISGFHVDPGFKGNLIYSVFNAGPSPIPISRGDPLFKLWIAELDGAVVEKYVFRSAKPQTEISNSLISEVAREVSSVQQMADRVKALETKYNIVVGILGGITAIALFLFAAARFLGLEFK
jgi:dCTP deaminase